MFAEFFIRRPIFAWVVGIVIMLAGAACLRTLPVAQYPDVAPPTIAITATYTGASAETVENSVTQIIEQQLTGLDGLVSFASTSSSAGTATTTVQFEQGTDPDIAQVQVQNKVQQAISRLPSAVQQLGVTVTKSQSDFLLIAALYDKTDRASSTDIADYLVSNLQDPISRAQGVGGVQVFGAPYAMRIWLDPRKLTSFGLMPSDVKAALPAQNAQVSAGQIGALPAAPGQQLSATVTAQSRLRTVEQFEAISLKDNPGGASVRLRDVARVELGSETYSNIVRLNGHPSSGVAVKLAPGANALSTAKNVKAVIAGLSDDMPDGYTIAYPKDSTQFIQLSIKEVVKTLFEAVALVVLVMFVFLQNWRATLIPALAVPVVMLGTFGVLSLLGYSINTLTMFGLVLAIGLLVDDAIVVVENVERVMHEDKLSPLDATIKSMREITGALFGIATVLSAVFLPMAFFSGSTGVIYRQFSITIVASMVLSVVVALTLTPALCATMLKPSAHGPSKTGFFGWFNRTFDRGVDRYAGGVGGILRRPLRWAIVFAVVVGGVAWLFLRMPASFLPTEDQGEIMVQFQLPTGATAERTLAAGQEVEKHFLETERDNVDAMFTIVGFNFAGSSQNSGLAFIKLKDWSVRQDEANRADMIAARATKKLSSLRDAVVYSLNPPAIQGLGQSNGFTLQLQAGTGMDRATLKGVRDKLLGAAAQDKALVGVRPNSLEDRPQLVVDVDQRKAAALGVALGDINDTLATAWGGSYVNDFIDRGRVKRVYVQADAPFRAVPSDLDQWYVRNASDKMTSFAAFGQPSWGWGPDALTRYNGLASYEIQGTAAPGTSSGSAMDRVEAIAGREAQGARHEWSGLSYQEKLAGGQTVALYAVSVLVVFLCLAALYESWSIPLSVLLVIPLGVFGALAATTLRGLENDVYFQVALLTTVGLSAKNAILIVEFVEAAHKRGASLIDAAIEGARLRLRPILMTSLAFVAGVVPLALSSGAGANSRVAIGTGVIGGTVAATVLGVFLVPLFFVLVQRMLGGDKKKPPAPEGTPLLEA